MSDPATPLLGHPDSARPVPARQRAPARDRLDQRKLARAAAALMSFALLLLPARSADRKKSLLPFGRRGGVESGLLNAPRLSKVDLVLAESLLVSLQPEPPQPAPNAQPLQRQSLLHRPCRGKRERAMAGITPLRPPFDALLRVNAQSRISTASPDQIIPSANTAA